MQKPVRDAAEVALDGTDGVSVLCAGAPATAATRRISRVDNRLNLGS